MEFSATGKGRMAMTVREPIGVIGCITPFNVPLNLALHKVAPALAGGNAVIHKPATKTPLSALRLARTMEEAGVPKGAYNVITGSGAQIGMAMAEHPGDRDAHLHRQPGGGAHHQIARRLQEGHAGIGQQLGGDYRARVGPEHGGRAHCAGGVLAQRAGLHLGAEGLRASLDRCRISWSA